MNECYLRRGSIRCCTIGCVTGHDVKTIFVLNPTVFDRHPTTIMMHIPELRYTRSCRSYQQCSEVLLRDTSNERDQLWILEHSTP
jgi:hypothetical protein